MVKMFDQIFEIKMPVCLPHPTTQEKNSRYSKTVFLTISPEFVDNSCIFWFWIF
jgi:hypothetical protein